MGLKGLNQKLVGYPLAQSTHCSVLNISQQMLNTNLLCFLCTNLSSNMLECFVRRTSIIVDFFHHFISFSGQSNPSGLRVDNNQNTVGAVLPDQVVDQDIILVELRTSMIPSNNTLLSIHLSEHVVHILKVLMIQEPYVLIKGNCKAVGYIKNTLTGP